MKDITIFENFINDEELEEVRQFTGEESLNINGEIYDENNQAINRQWYFVPQDNGYKKVLVDLRHERVVALNMENIIPSAKNFILKMKNRIDISESTAISMPMKNLLAIISAVALGVWAYFGVLERITMLETKAQLSEKDLNQVTETLSADIE